MAIDWERVDAETTPPPEQAAQSLYDQAAQLKAAGRLEESLHILEQLVSIDPDHKLAQYSLAAAYASVRGDPDKACQHLLEVQRIEPGEQRSYEAWKPLVKQLPRGRRLVSLSTAGELFLQQGRGEAAREALAQALSLDPGREDLTCLLARARLLCGEQREAVDEVAALLSAQPRSQPARAVLQGMLPELSSAARGRAHLALARAARAAEDNERAAVHCAAVLDAQPDHAEAQDLLKSLAGDEGDTALRARQDLCRAYIASGHTESAAEELSQLALLAEQGRLPHATVAGLFEDLGDLPSAAEQWLAALHQQPDDESAVEQIARLGTQSDNPAMGGVVFAAGELMLTVGRVEAAYELLRLALPIRPDDAGLRLKFAEVCRAAGEPRQALESYRMALVHQPDLAQHLDSWRALLDELQPQEADAVRRRLAATLLDVERPRDARVDLEALLAQHPDDIELLGAMSNCCAAEQDWTAAAENLAQVIRLQADDETVHRELDAILEQAPSETRQRLHREMAELCAQREQPALERIHLERLCTLQPDEPAWPLRLGVASAALSEWERAAEHLLAAAALEADSAEAVSELDKILPHLDASLTEDCRRRLVAVLLDHQRLSEAAGHAATLPADAACAPVHARLARMANQHGDHLLAVRHGLAALEGDCEDADIAEMVAAGLPRLPADDLFGQWTRFVHYHLRCGGIDAARENAESLAAAALETPHHWRQLSRLFLDVGLATRAVESAVAAVCAEPDSDETREQYVSALEAADVSLVADPVRRCAEAWTAAGQLQWARTEWERYIASRPHDAEARKQLSGLVESLGEIESALQQMLKVLEVQPGDADTVQRLRELLSRVPASRRRELRLDLVDTFQSSGLPGEAAEELRRVHEEWPDDERVCCLLARQYVLTDDYERAARQWLRALALRPDNREAHNEFLKLLPRLGARVARELRMVAGRLLVRAGQHEHALAHYQSLIQANPSDSEALAGAAAAEEWLGRYRRAANRWLSCLRLDPQTDGALRQLRALLPKLEDREADELRLALCRLLAQHDLLTEATQEMRRLPVELAASIHLEIAQEKADQGDHQTALHHALEATQGDDASAPDLVERLLRECDPAWQPDARRRLIQIHLAHRRYAAACKQVQALAELLDSSSASLHELADFYHAAGDRVSAARSLCAALQQNPGSATLQEKFRRISEEVDGAGIEDILVDAAAVFADNGNPQETVRLLQLALRRRPDDAQILLALGDVLRAQGDRMTALEHYQSALRQGDPEGAAYERIDEVLHTLPQEQVARVRMRLGEHFFDRGLLERAIAELELVNSLEPDSQETHQRLADAHQRLGNLESAVEHLVQVLRLRPVNVEARHRILELLGEMSPARQQSVHLRLGKLFEAAGHAAAAAEHLVAVTRLDPSHVEANLGAARALSVIGDYDNGARHAMQAIALRPTDDAARAQLEELLAKLALPRVVECRWELARLYLDRELAAIAVEELQALLKLGEQSVAVHAELANAQLMLGDARAAAGHALDALALEPDHEQAYRQFQSACRRLSERERLRLYDRAAELFLQSGPPHRAAEQLAESLRLRNDKRVMQRLMSALDRCDDRHAARLSAELAEFCLERGWSARALDLYQRCQQAAPDSPAAYLGLARAAELLDRRQDAVDHLLTVLRLHAADGEVVRRLLSLLPSLPPPAAAAGYLQAAECFADREDYQRAAQILEAAGDVAPGNEDVELHLAIYKTQVGDESGARDALLRLLRRAPRNRHAYETLTKSSAGLAGEEAYRLHSRVAEVFEAAEMHAEAIIELEAARSLRADPSVSRRLLEQRLRHAEELLSRDDVTRAREQLEAALRIDPSNREAHSAMGKALLYQHETMPSERALSAAERHLQAAVESGVGGDDSDALRLAELYHVRGSFEAARQYCFVAEQHLQRGDHALAIARFREALERGLNWPRVHLRLAAAHRELGELVEAERCIRSAMEIAQTLTDEAEQNEARAAVVEAMDALAHAHFDQQQFPHAQRLFEEVVALDPQRREAQSYIEYSEMWQGKPRPLQQS